MVNVIHNVRIQFLLHANDLGGLLLLMDSGLVGQQRPATYASHSGQPITQSLQCSKDQLSSTGNIYKYEQWPLTLWCTRRSLETTKTCSNWTMRIGNNLKTTTPIYTALIRLFRAIVELSFDVMFNRGRY